MSDPKGPFEAAVRAGCDMDGCEYPTCLKSRLSECRDYVRQSTKMLAALLPPDPAPETLSAMWHAYLIAEAEEEMRDAYRALRASLLPGEEPS